MTIPIVPKPAADPAAPPAAATPAPQAAATSSAAGPSTLPPTFSSATAAQYPPAGPAAMGHPGLQQGVGGTEIEVDDISDEGDSAFGDELSNYTTSLSPSVTNYPIENGRRYHAFREGVYILPNDEEENDRLDLQHQMLFLLFGLHRAPLQNPQRILDVGTGTGIWALEMADKFPSAEVIGNDLSPIQPTWVPPNLKFEVDDAESDWSFKEKFDYVHIRYMGGSVADWPRLIGQAYKHIKPGGYLEMQEIMGELYSDDGTMPTDSAVKKWADLFAEAAEKRGRTVKHPPKLKGWAENAGFLHVQQEVYKLPSSPWPKDPKLKEIGAFNLVNLLEGLMALSLALFTRVHGWSSEEVEAFMPEVRNELKRKDIHTMGDVYCVWGQKPIDAVG